VSVPTDLDRSRKGRSPGSTPRARARPAWGARILKGAVVFVAVCVLLAGGGYFYLRHQLGRISRLSIPGLSSDRSGGVMNVLLVGSDSRANTTGDLAEESGKAIEGDRPGLSDTMMILHIDPKQAQAAILSIPRDLWVQVNGSKDRINAAFAAGGPQLLIRTIQDSLGVQINHYAEVDFSGFQRIVDTVGGLKIYIDAPARDDKSGLDLPNAGCVQLDGSQALAYVRSRYYESYEAGRWVSDPTSDFGRIKRQQDFIRRMIRKALTSGLSNPLTLNRLIGIGVQNLTVDRSMSTSDMVTVARRFRSLDPDSVDMQTLPTTPYTTAGGADVLLVDGGAAQPLIDKINGKAPPASVGVTPSEVQVRVLNGNGSTGAASKVAGMLQSAGFEVTGSGDADTFSYAKTVIRYAGPSRAKAQFLQGHLSAGATLEEDATLGTADVALVVGADFTGVRSSSAAATGASPDAGPATTAAQPSPPPSAKGSGQPAC
jgi:LCP family protein required for cell wall assembly